VMGTASFRTALIEISMDELGCAPSANEEIIYFLIKLFKISNMPRSQRNDDFIEGAHVLRQGAAAHFECDYPQLVWLLYKSIRS